MAKKIPTLGKYEFQSGLMDRILENSRPNDNGCWIWYGAKVPQGYGVLNWRGDSYFAHRLSYELFVSDIPDGLQIDHLCREKACCNPDHLEVVTASENCKRIPLRDFCVRGHDLRLDGSFYHRKTKGGGKSRLCKLCKSENNKKYRLARK